MPRPLAPTQLALLRAINAGIAEVYATPGGSALRGDWAKPVVWQATPNSSMKWKVTTAYNKLRAAELVRLGPVGVRFHAPRKVLLTDAGRQALADIDTAPAPEEG